MSALSANRSDILSVQLVWENGNLATSAMQRTADCSTRTDIDVTRAAVFGVPTSAAGIWLTKLTRCPEIFTDSRVRLRPKLS
jgi:hypothetical protein